jgi:hypothetical protein
MITRKGLHSVGASLLAASMIPWLFLGACSNSNSNPVPTYNLGSDAGDAGNAGHKPDATTDASHDGKADVVVSSDAVTPQPDGQPPTDGAVPADALVDVALVDGHFVDAAVCSTDGGCYKCTPTTNEEFLNQCTASSCAPFNNGQRLPNYDGGLPPLN